jgi:Ca2+-binding EF-hand superfamily protein
MKTLHRTAVLLLSLAAASAFAQSNDRPNMGNMTPEQRAQRMAERFNAADTNHDGKLTLDEAKAGLPMVARNFDQIDKAKTGSITLEQLTEAMKNMPRGGGRGGQGRQGGAQGGQEGGGQMQQ